MKQRIGIVSHDAGGAELISHLLKKTDADYLFSLQGPAVSIFKRNFGNLKNIDLERLVTESDLLVCGTSWQSTHENQALYLAKEKNKRAISVLDHYSCYLERYVKNGFHIIPPELWVTDEHSLKLAQAIAPNANITIVGNPYLDEMERNFDRIEKPTLRADGFDILYLSEPIALQAGAQYGDQNYWRFNEFTAFEYFLANIRKITAKSNIIISIRRHPAEARNKYEQLVTKRDDVEIKLSTESDLLTEMANSHAVVGVDTIALLVALRIGKPVFSSLPPLTIEPTLPPAGITYLREL